MRRESSSGSKLMAEMNVTPFVDVALVLLIIFMVVTPMIVVEADVPHTDDPLAAPETDRQVRILLIDESTLVLNGQVLRRDQLAAALSDLERTREVVVKAPRTGRYGEVGEILEVCRDAGFENVVLAAVRRG